MSQSEVRAYLTTDDDLFVVFELDRRPRADALDQMIRLLIRARDAEDPGSAPARLWVTAHDTPLAPVAAGRAPTVTRCEPCAGTGHMPSGAACAQCLGEGVHVQLARVVPRSMAAAVDG